MPDVPLELVELILTHADKDSRVLKACSLVCSSWRGLAQRQLFTHAVVPITSYEHLGSVGYPDLVANQYHSSLIQTVTTIRVFPLPLSSISPSFAEFIHLLVQVNQIIFSGIEGSKYSVAIPSMFSFFGSSQLRSVRIETKLFPLYLLRAFIHVQELTWSREATMTPQSQASLLELELPEGPTSKRIQSINIEGLGDTLASLFQGLRAHQRHFSLSRAETASIYFLDSPTETFGNFTPFPLFRNVTNLTLRFRDSQLFESNFNPHPLLRLQTLKLITSITQDEWFDPLLSLHRLMMGFRQFETPSLKNLRNVQLEILDETLFLPGLPDGQRDTSDNELRGACLQFTNRLPRLTELSVYAPWLVYDDAARIFDAGRELRADVHFQCGPLAPGSPHVPQTLRAQRARQKRLKRGSSNR